MQRNISDLDEMTASQLLPILAPIVAATAGTFIVARLDGNPAFITI
jgi:hypothetical protein